MIQYTVAIPSRSHKRTSWAWGNVMSMEEPHAHKGVNGVTFRVIAQSLPR
jgi:hypothetical protein